MCLIVCISVVLGVCVVSGVHMREGETVLAPCCRVRAKNTKKAKAGQEVH